MPIYPLADFEVVSILFWSVVIIALLAAAFIGVKALNKWMATDDTSGGATNFSLSDLRQLVKAGKMTPEEFEKAKAILLATVQKPDASANSTGRPPIEPKGQ